MVIGISVLSVFFGEIICFNVFEWFILVLVFFKYGVFVNVIEELDVIFLVEVMRLLNLFFVEKLM